MGCTGCAGSGVMVGPRRRPFDGAPRRSGGAGRALPARDCGCGCGGACALPDPAPVGAGAVMSSGLEARQRDAAMEYQRLMGRGAGLTGLSYEDGGDGSDVPEENISRSPDAAARFARLSSAKREAIARAAARDAGANEAQTAAAVSAAVSRGLDALNDYLAGRFRVRISEITSARDIAIARIGSEERIRLRILSNGTAVPAGAATTTTTAIAAVGGIALLGLLLRGGR